ncbi:hypothetical protein [Pedobacter punctiformis]|uniref:Uncharacterized protein n=1 Tax=Pedobacter punctiformis TaxID=3004097 RepID=A0ABT4L9M5_9SPHI|nr:hypothetical protein [Pedobacter sp. HCMS5-2]MCZ4244611.1 hypothetical protein [Pedobacter sp. HCMS5-2]
MKKFTLRLKLPVFLAFSVFLCAFASFDSIDEYVNYLQKSFTDHYDVNQESDQIKKYELNVTNNGFCRYKRYFNNGKIEYFAFKLAKFKDIDYIGSTLSGKLYLHTKSDDVIVQTYNDKSGDVDSMGTCVAIPVKNIEAEDLNQIREAFVKLTASGQVIKP